MKNWQKCFIKAFLPSEKSVELSVDFVCYRGKVFRTMFKIEVVGFYDKYFAFVVRDPLLVSVVQIAQIIDTDTFFVVPSSHLNLRYEGRD